MNKAVILSLLTISFSALSSCQRTPVFYREKELLNFLEVNNITFSQESTIVLLLVGSGCNTCVESTKKVLVELKENRTERVVAIIGDELAGKEYLPYISSNSSIILTNKEDLLSKGLLFPSDLVFFIDNSKCISKQEEISNQTMSEIFKEIQRLNIKHWLNN